MNKTNWIWTQDWPEKKKAEEPVIVYFRKKINHARQIKISANCRYKLYINGNFVQEGPQKGSSEAAYLDTADIEKYMEGQENVLAVEVLYYPEDFDKRNDSLYYSCFPGLYVEDVDGDQANAIEGWKYRYADHIRILGEDFRPAPIHESEAVSGQEKMSGWKKPEYDDSDWTEAENYDFFTVNKPIAPFNMEERTIPPMKHEPGRFTEVVCVREPADGKEEIKAGWENLIGGRESVTVQAHSKWIVEIGAGEEMCGYPRLALAGGRDSRIEILYSECYGILQPDQVTPFGTHPSTPIKGDRTDYIKGRLTGSRDSYRVGGFGTADKPEEYETYLFRTFRYIGIEIETGDEELQILNYDYISTGYPLEVRNHPVSENEEYNRIWDISLRTLKRCMHETYVDCPFYEQLQYTMDSRAEILFTYEVSGDDRLARQCMDSFRRTQRSDGMIQASAPAVGVNVIPGFSMFYIMMVNDHMKRFGDLELVRNHMACVDGILNYFDRHLTEKGLVGSVGGVLFQHKYWSFIDWTDEWNDNIGVPLAANYGDKSITMESLLYIYGLKRAAELAEALGRDSTAEEYRMRAEKVSEALMKYCRDDRGLITDGPGQKLYSTHCQVWAILDDLVDVEEGRKMLEATYGKAEASQCSVSMSFYLFLAFEKLGMLDTELADSMWNPWRKMLKDNMTTCVENTTDGRSDCHAWGSLMLYALPRIIKAKSLDRESVENESKI